MQKQGYKIKKWFPVPFNAWHDFEGLYSEIVRYLQQCNQNQLLLFCSGPVSNIIIHRLFQIQPQHTYLDIGSSLDDVMGLGITRGYQRTFGWQKHAVCYWYRQQYRSQVCCDSHKISFLRKLKLKLTPYSI